MWPGQQRKSPETSKSNGMTEKDDSQLIGRFRLLDSAKIEVGAATPYLRRLERLFPEYIHVGSHGLIEYSPDAVAVLSRWKTDPSSYRRDLEQRMHRAQRDALRAWEDWMDLIGDDAARVQRKIGAEKFRRATALAHTIDRSALVSKDGALSSLPQGAEQDIQAQAKELLEITSDAEDVMDESDEGGRMSPPL